MIFFGICAGISSLVSGTIITYSGRVPVFIFFISTSVAASILMLRWEPSENESIFFFIISGIWGAMQGSLTPQINGLFYFKMLLLYMLQVTMIIDHLVQIDPVILLVGLDRLNLNQPMECL